MSKLWTTFLKDAKLSFNGLYFYIEIGLAFIFVAVMLFVVPENFESGQKINAFVNLDEPIKSQIEEQITSEDDSLLYDSRTALEDSLEKDRSAVGIEIKSNGSGEIIYDFVLQGYENDRIKSLLKSTVEGEFLSSIPGFESSVSYDVLEPDSQRLTDRANILPIYLTINVGLMGLFIIAAYIFLDKDEGVIKAYAVAPVKIWQYLAAKMLIMLLMGLITSIIPVLMLAGTDVNFLLLIVMVSSFNLFGSALGLFVSSFFDSMVKAMGGLYAAVMLMVLPSLSYFAPSFNPAWIKVFPSYPMMFAFRELLLKNGDTGYIWMQTVLFLILALLVFFAANLRFKKTLTV
ncbi:ABC transporter permease [Alkalibacter mobilis]|uniref:ABC transporter permease n=1 Tax=Alkalibacter mobilis TaxID=2787712 RepID=UPI00189C7E0D|nr:ABC transporter permease [Alkalibacter mobilis]MBF7097149.1 ABC transporter permease [Alkalibacter mobilis]